MSVGSLCVVLVLAGIATLAAYMARVYSEYGKILSREVQDNLDAWELHVEPRLGLTRERAALSSWVLMQVAMGMLALEFGSVLFDRAPGLARPTLEEICQAVLAVVLAAVFCTQVIPFLLVQRTQGVVGGAAAVADTAAAVCDLSCDAAGEFFCSRLPRWPRSRRQPKKRRLAMWRRCWRRVRKREFWRRATASWCARRWSLATSWCGM